GINPLAMEQKRAAAAALAARGVARATERGPALADEIRRAANWAFAAEQLGQVVSPDVAAHQCGLLRCIFGNPFRPIAPDPAWRSGNSVALARTIYDDRCFELLPLLADLLEE